MSRERTSAGNILARVQSTEEKAKDIEEAATSYMPTNIDLETLMPDGSASAQAKTVLSEPDSSKTRIPASLENKRGSEPKAPKTARASVKRKRVSLYLDDDVLTKIFRVSLEQHEQLSSATHRLILEALKARGL
ncbi:hypothetical protein [Agrobacterium pusense]|uniref:Uncharacterized protein n=1 Tax=Agrobacterium pusense TaxID=648995 RepID=U4Q3N9_9HYPH|nr:hypothetical protein [Agrobacterium pusense]CDI11917.1 conserved protein of unknown function [Agrobacterium pusense]